MHARASVEETDTETLSLVVGGQPAHNEVTQVAHRSDVTTCQQEALDVRPPRGALSFGPRRDEDDHVHVHEDECDVSSGDEQPPKQTPATKAPQQVDIPDTTLTAQLDHEEWPIAEDTTFEDEDSFLPDATGPRPLAGEVLTVFDLHARVDAILSWENMIAYLAICGRAPFSAAQYNFLRLALSTASSTDTLQLHKYATARRHMRSHLARWCFPKTSIEHISSATKPRAWKSVKRLMTSKGEKKPAQECAMMVSPSEWAKMDVATYTFYSDVYEHPDRDSPERLSIERAPIVQRRAPFVGRDLVLWSLFEGVTCITKTGDKVKIPCAAPPSQVENRRCVAPKWFDGLRNPEQGDAVDVTAVFVGMWMIGPVTGPGERARPPKPPALFDEWTTHEQALQRKYNRPSPTQPSMDTVLEAELNAKKDDTADDVGSNHKAQTHLAYSTNVVELHPGDVCVLFRAEEVHKEVVRHGANFKEENKSQHCLLIGSMIRQGIGRSAERLLWLDIENRHAGRATVRYVGTCNVTDVPTWLGGPRGTPQEGYGFEKQRHIGYLSDGSRFVVYRFGLYVDGFQQTKSVRDTRSVGGCYILPLGLSLHNRRGTSAPRVITVCPSDASRDAMLRHVFDDISRAASEGIDGLDPYGRRVRIFLDMVTFFADYLEAAYYTDVLGHNANAYCTHCSVRRGDRRVGSKYLTNTMNNSRRLGFMRSDARLFAIRQSPFAKTIYRALGIASTDNECAEKVPVVKFSMSLDVATRPERTCTQEEITPLFFESSLSCATAPDHMFTGLMKNTLTAAFNAVGTDARRHAMESRIVSTLRENGLPVTGRLLNWASDGTYKGLNNHTMSTLNCLLLCSAPTFDAEHRVTGKRVFELVRALQNYVAAAYYWPSVRTDGRKHAPMFTVDGRLKYNAKIRALAFKYLRMCDEVLEEDAELGAVLDKPNAHRAVELAVHTIPTFGHARNCSEFVLEQMHQVFKGWLERNPHQDSHISAVERALTRDWMGRVYALFQVWKKGSTRERACSEVGLRRLLLGEGAVHLNEEESGVTDFKERFHNAMQTSFREPTMEMMSECGHLSLPRARRVGWEVLEGDKMAADKVGELCGAFASGLAQLGREYKLATGKELEVLKVYSTARLEYRDVYEGKRRTYKFNEVGENCVVTCVAEEGVGVVREACMGIGEDVRYFAVLAVVKGPDNKLWAVTKAMARARPDLRNAYGVSIGACVVVQLTAAVRRAGAAHLCDSDCMFSQRGLSVRHSATVCDGGLYELWCAREGYPPHMG